MDCLVKACGQFSRELFGAQVGSSARGLKDRSREEVAALLGVPPESVERISIFGALASFFHAVAGVCDWIGDGFDAVGNLWDSLSPFT